MKNRLRSTILFFLIFTSYSLLQASEQATTEQAVYTKNIEFLTNAILDYQAIKHNASKTEKEKKIARKNLLNLILQLPPIISFDSKIKVSTINDINTDILATALSIFAKSEPQSDLEISQDIATLQDINEKLIAKFNPFESMYKTDAVQQNLNNSLKKVLSKEYISGDIKNQSIKLLINAKADIWSVNLPNLTNDLKIKILETIQPETPQEELNRNFANAFLAFDATKNPIFLNQMITLQKQGADIHNFASVIDATILKNPIHIEKEIKKIIQAKLDGFRSLISNKECAMGYDPYRSISKKRMEIESPYRESFLTMLENLIKDQNLLLNSLKPIEILELLSLYCDLSFIKPKKSSYRSTTSQDYNMIFPYYDLNHLEKMKPLTLLVQKLDKDWINNQDIGTRDIYLPVDGTSRLQHSKERIDNFFRTSGYFQPTPKIRDRPYNLLDKALATGCIDLAYILLQHDIKTLQKPDNIFTHYATYFPTYLTAYSLWDWKRTEYYDEDNRLCSFFFNKDFNNQINYEIITMPGFDINEKLDLFNFKEPRASLAELLQSEEIPQDEKLRFLKLLKSDFTAVSSLIQEKKRNTAIAMTLAQLLDISDEPI